MREYHPLRAAVRPQRRRAMAMRNGSYLLISCGVLGMLVAFVLEGAIMMSAASGITLLGLALNSMGREVVSVCPSMLIAGTCALQFSFSNARAIAAMNTSSQPEYLAYPVPEYFYAASLIGALGGIALWAGTRFTERKESWTTAPIKKSPFSVTFVVPEHRAHRLLLQILAASVIINVFVPVAWLGSIGSVIQLIPLLVVFLWSRLLDLKRTRGWLIFYLLVGALAIHAFFFAFLRLQIILPILLAMLGLLSTHGFKFLKSVRLVPMVVMLVVFAALFSILGEVRNTSTGIGRWATLTEKLGTEDAERGLTLLGRISTISQLTQIVRLTEENGLYQGKTVEYLGYVFIPRVFWPEKPIIAKGQWFAEEIDQGRVLESGQFSNSINMTVPGELYLNFSYPGVVLGCFIAGAVLGLVHRSVSSGGPYDLLGGSMVGYVFFVAATTGADLQVLVSFIAIYLVFVGVYHSLELLYRKRRRARAPETSRVPVRVIRRA
jgi:hypothetical protein